MAKPTRLPEPTAGQSLWVRRGIERINQLTHNSRWTESLAIFAVTVIAYELLWLLQFHYEPITRVSLGLVLLAVIVTAAFRGGLRPGLTIALLSNIYLFLAFSGEGRDVTPIDQLLRSEWLIIILFFGPALVVGYLSERVVMLLARERAARELAEQEQIRLTTILQQLPVGVVIADARSGEVVFGNQYMEQLLGHSSVGNNVSSVEQPNGNKLGRISRHEAHNELPTLPLEEWPLKQVIAGQILQNEEYAYVHAGHEHILRVSGTPIFNAHNQIAAGVVIIDDITDEKQVQQRKDDFLSMVSHELKTPLTSLKVYTQLASRQLEQATGNSAPAAGTLEKINNQADKLTQTITDMLILARAQSGRLEYRYVRSDVMKLASSVVEDLRPTAPHHALHLDGQCPKPVELDEERMAQVLVNLINNAIKYSPQADTINIHVREQDDGVIISVQDFGIGIKKRDQNRIFDRFFQAPDASGRTYPGLGVGLYLCAEIVEHHHGRIWLSSEIDKGSTFYVWLPFRQSGKKNGSDASTKPPAAAT
jgi:signal transduction histidine kinase